MKPGSYFAGKTEHIH